MFGGPWPATPAVRPVWRRPVRPSEPVAALGYGSGRPDGVSVLSVAVLGFNAVSSRATASDGSSKTASIRARSSGSPQTAPLGFAEVVRDGLHRADGLVSAVTGVPGFARAAFASSGSSPQGYIFTHYYTLSRIFSDLRCS